MEKIIRKKRGNRSKFDDATRRRAVLEYANGNLSMVAVGLKYGVSHKAIGDWISWYERDQQHLLTLGMEGTNADLPSSAGSDIEAPVSSTEDVKALQEELRIAKIKLACLETLIDITEQDLGIDIRKKAGTKSSGE